MTSQTRGALPAASEQVVRSWSAPVGRCVLTTLRCSLLRRHRLFQWSEVWSVRLQDVKVVEVTQLGGVDSPAVPTGGPSFETVGLSGIRAPGEYSVTIDNTPVFHGSARNCARIQEWIERARLGRG